MFSSAGECQLIHNREAEQSASHTCSQDGQWPPARSGSAAAVWRAGPQQLEPVRVHRPDAPPGPMAVQTMATVGRTRCSFLMSACTRRGGHCSAQGRIARTWRWLANAVLPPIAAIHRCCAPDRIVHRARARAGGEEWRRRLQSAPARQRHARQLEGGAQGSSCAPVSRAVAAGGSAAVDRAPSGEVAETSRSTASRACQIAGRHSLPIPLASHIRARWRAGDENGGPAIKRATYAELESINVDLSAMPAVQFFRVEVRHLGPPVLMGRSPVAPTRVRMHD